MKQTLTKREKILLYVLLCVIIGVGGIFLLIMPVMETHTDLKSANNIAETQLISAKAAIPTYGDLDKETKETNEQLKSIKDKFYNGMKKEDVDKLITQLALDHSLVPTSLNISAVTEEEVMSYEEKLKADAKAEKAGSATTSETKKNKNSTMKTYNVTLNVEGSIKNLQSMINDANKLKSLKIGSVNYDGTQETMNVTFKIFMID